MLQAREGVLESDDRTAIFLFHGFHDHQWQKVIPGLTVNFTAPVMSAL